MRHISLLNVGTKITSKTFAAKLKPILPLLSLQIKLRMWKKRCINESGRLIYDILEICDKENISVYLVTIDLENAFDPLDHDFLLCVFGKDWRW